MSNYNLTYISSGQAIFVIIVGLEQNTDFPLFYYAMSKIRRTQNFLMF